MVWSVGDRVEFKKWIGPTTETLVMVRDGNIDKVVGWYDRQELDVVDQVLIRKISEDINWFKKVCEVYWLHWNHLLPYMEQKKSFSSVDDLKRYYENWIAWWGPMDIIYYLPDIEAVSIEVKNEALGIREKTQHLSDEGGQVIDDFIARFFPEYGELAYFMLPQELFLLGQGRLDAKMHEEIELRAQGWALINDDLMLIGDLDIELKGRGWRIGKEVDAKAREVRGQTACPGLVRGKVRLVLEEDQLDEVQEGEILVTEMTSPYFVPAMKRAAAIVTDEGGVTSHAAIASREMGKPCVIGTRVGTQVFRNGDEVEVNADRGVVRVVARAKDEAKKQPEQARA